MIVHLGLISKVLPASLTDWSVWVGFYTSSSQQGVKYQLDIWIFICGGVSLLISYEKYIKDVKVLDHLGFLSKELPGPLTDWSAGWVYAHSRVSNINFDIWIYFVEGGSLLISHEKYIKDGKVLVHLGSQSKILPAPLTDWSAWVGFCTSSPQ